jgi:hypothetical protein
MTSPFAGLPFTVPAQYQGLILLASQRWGIPANVLAAQLDAESGFNPQAQSDAGAEGIAQFEPSTAAGLGVNPWSPSSAIDGMAHLDSEYVKQFGSIDLALAAYNAGPGSIVNGQIPSIPETQNYVTKILTSAGLAGPTGTNPNPADTSVPSSGNVGTLLSDIVNPAFWSRVGKGALAAGVVGVGVYFLIEKQPGSMKPVRDLVNVK